MGNNMSAREESLKDHALFRDFARLVIAPHVIVNGAGSSWAFYSAFAAAPHVIFGDADEGHIEALATPPRRFHVPSPVYHAAKSKTGRSVVVHADALSEALTSGSRHIEKRRCKRALPRRSRCFV